MGIVAITTSTEREYVSPADSDYKADGQHGPEATKFKIGSLDGYQQAQVSEVRNRYTMKTAEDGKKSVDVNLHIYEGAYEALRYGLRGWVNFKDGLGRIVEFKTEEAQVGRRRMTVVTEETLALIDPDLALELAREVARVNTVTEVEAKN